MQQIRSILRPIGRSYHTPPEETDVEAVLLRPHIDRLFLAGEQIEEQRPEPVALQSLGD